MTTELSSIPENIANQDKFGYNHMFGLQNDVSFILSIYL